MYLAEGVCEKCNEKCQIARLCSKCFKEKEDEERRKYFEELDQLTLEQRVRRLEEIEYRKNHGRTIDWRLF